MSKKCYRFFGGLLNAQAKWLNKMSEKGYRLVRTGKLLYEFEKCKPDEVTYCVEFIGEKSKENSIDYANFLEDMGYKVFFKNINLNYYHALMRQYKLEKEVERIVFQKEAAGKKHQNACKSESETAARN